MFLQLPHLSLIHFDTMPRATKPTSSARVVRQCPVPGTPDAPSPRPPARRERCHVRNTGPLGPHGPQGPGRGVRCRARGAFEAGKNVLLMTGRGISVHLLSQNG